MTQELIFQGSPYEIGLQHGVALQSEIKQVLQLYLHLWNLPEEKIAPAVHGFQRSVESYFPHLAEEIGGIAEGARMSEDYIYAINARTELLRDASLLECTAIGIPASLKSGNDVVLGQNWDWDNRFRGLTRVVEVRPEKGPRMKMLIEPGMVGKIGMNDAGVGVCLNFLETTHGHSERIPVHVLLRGILEQENYGAAEALVRAVPRAASANYLVGDHNGKMSSLETSPENVTALLGDPIVTHTNTFLARGEPCARREYVERTLREYLQKDVRGKLSPRAIKNALALPGVQASRVAVGGIETLHTIIMNLTKERFSVSEGAQSNVFTAYHFA